MTEHCKYILDNIFLIIVECNKTTKCSRVCKKQYREILDNISTNIITDSFENESVIKAIMKLSVLERVVIVFYFILDFNLTEISIAIHATPASVYSQKSKAIKKMRKILTVS